MSVVSGRTATSSVRPMLHPAAAPRRRRAAAMVEFALLLPLFVFFVMFTVDMGRMVIMRAQLHDATQQAARAGAQIGDAAGGGGTSKIAFDQSLQDAPLLQPGLATMLIMQNSCSQAGNQYVAIRGEYPTTLVTPGLGAMLNLFNAGGVNTAGTWTLRATSVARCEIRV
jgi:Flp pilus assembly protein TadG